MPKRKFESETELDLYYNQACESIAKDNEIHSKVMDEIFRIFTNGVQYTDKTTNTRKTFNSRMLSTTEKKKAAEIIFEEGTETIHECNRYPGGVCQGMIWYAMTQGVSTEELYELGQNPDSETSASIKARLDTMKQNYHDMITSNDTEKLSDFYMDCFRHFAKSSNEYLNCRTVDGIQKHWKKLMFWSGAGALLQQSLKYNYDNLTPKQLELTSKLNTEIQRIWGPDANLKTVVSVMNSIHKIDTSFEARNINSLEAYNELKAKDKEAATTALSNSVLIFHLVHEEMKKELDRGEMPRIFSSKVAKTAVTNESTYQNLLMDHLTEKKLLMAERKFLAGDQSGFLLYNADHVCDYEDSLPDSPISIEKGAEDKAHFFSDVELDELREEYFLKDDGFDSESFRDRLDRKAKKNENLSGLEIGLFMADGDLFGSKEQSIYEHFMGQSDMLRFSDLPVTMRGILGTISRTHYGMEPEVFISRANVVKNACDMSFRKTAKEIKNGNSTGLINLKDNEAMLKGLRKSLSDVDVTIASSDEFKNLASAFRRVDKPADQIRGHEEEYKEDMKALAEAAKVYIQAKNKGDNTKERFTDKGQKRLNLARRMEAFGNATAAGMEKTKLALEKKGLAVDNDPSNVTLEDQIYDMNPDEPSSKLALEEPNEPVPNAPVIAGFHI